MHIWTCTYVSFLYYCVVLLSPLQLNISNLDRVREWVPSEELETPWFGHLRPTRPIVDPCLSRADGPSVEFKDVAVACDWERDKDPLERRSDCEEGPGHFGLEENWNGSWENHEAEVNHDSDKEEELEAPAASQLLLGLEQSKTYFDIKCAQLLQSTSCFRKINWYF